MWDKVGQLYGCHGDVPVEVRLLKQLAVGGPGGFQLVRAFVELDFQVQGLLFKVEDAGLDTVDVGRRADSRSLPDMLAQFGAEAVLQQPDLV
jgi:hypothetical protein